MTSRKIPLRTITAIVLLSAGTAALAELSDDSRYRAPPFLVATTSWHSTAAFANPPGSVRTREYGLQLGLQRFERKHAWVDLEIDYQYSHFAFGDVDSRNRDVHRLRFPVRFAAEFGQGIVRGYVAPGIATSSNVFKDFLNRGSSDDLTIAGRIELGGAELSKRWIIGIAYDQSFGRPRFYPVAGIDRQLHDDLRVRVAFPDPGIWYRITDRHRLSARLFPSGDRWRVVTDDFASDFDLRREEWRAQLTWSMTLGKWMSVDLAAGQTFDRRLLLTDRAGVAVDQDISSEGFAKIGFRFGGNPSNR